MSEVRFADVIIIGAGVGGLAAAKTYLEQDPTADVLLLEQRNTLGGVWSKENCHDNLRTNNLKGTLEFSAFPLGDEYGVEDGTHIPGVVLHKYFSDFAAHFDLVRRIHLNTKVLSVLKSESGWEISSIVSDSAGVLEVKYHSNKLIVCTGLFSTANPVSIPGIDVFGKPVLNQGQMSVEGYAVAGDATVERVTVVSSSKAGYDAVELMASHGKSVDWVILKFDSVANMRFFAWFSPCVWGHFDGFQWIRNFLHRTLLGYWLVYGLWEALRCLFWSARVGILNYPGNFHDYVTSGQVRIVRKDISHLSEGGQVHLSDGVVLKSDALIASTGWNLAQSIRYYPAGLEASLGVPTADLTAEEESFWNYLDQEADDQILSRFPMLRKGPRRPIPYTQKVSAFRLYRGIAPPGLTARGDRSIAFVDMIHSTGTTIIAETQSLWAYAYLNNKLDIDEKKVYWQTALMSRYGKHRYPCGFSVWFPEFVFDTVPYADMLMGDLGLRKWRKKTWLQEIFGRYSSRDYKDVNQEWKQKQSTKGGFAKY
ncbi:hypothetical protein DV735_g1264, partial [Chaetothyriales sp. CBS 134920]